MDKKFALGVLAVLILVGLLTLGGGNETGISNQVAGVGTVFNVNPMVTLETNYGVITLELFADKAPVTVANFSKLAQSGFYDGTLFHRVIKNFMIQGGDPTTKEAPQDWTRHGTGGPGYAFADEINDEPLVRGTLAMANAGPGTNGSQFFIVTAESTPWLDGKHTAFGKVTTGYEVVEKIENLPTDPNRGDHPLSDVVVTKVTLTDLGVYWIVGLDKFRSSHFFQEAVYGYRWIGGTGCPSL